MNPKLTADALAYWEGWKFGDYPLPDLGALDEILAAARRWVDLFEECENCDSDGKRLAYIDGVPQFHTDGTELYDP